MEQELADVKKALLADVERGISLYEFPRKCDNFFYNWGTGLAILLNVYATAVPKDDMTDFTRVSALIAGCVATAWIAVDRILLFGPRWRFSLEQQGAFRGIQVRANAVELEEQDAQKTALLELNHQVAALFERDRELPGISGGNPV